MRLLSAKFLIETTFILMIGVMWCELGYYYYVNYTVCPNWPGGQALDGSNMTKILIIADPHIMGSYKSYKIDKIRREWQMKQTFTISNQLLRPDVIIFIGDLLDEGYFEDDLNFAKDSECFERVFTLVNSKQKRIIIPGNHDVGFHNHMTHYDYYLRRFLKRFRSIPYIERVDSHDLKRFNIILANSMMFYNDTCPFCSMAISETEQLASMLNQERYLADFADPVLIKHIPLYRKDDTTCNHPFTMHKRVEKPNVQGIDVLHAEASKLLLQKLKPRLVISGHTHLECHTNHGFSSSSTDLAKEANIGEITVSSYNHKYAESRPGYLLLSITTDHIFTKHCDMIEEWVILIVYISLIVIIIMRLMPFNQLK